MLDGPLATNVAMILLGMAVGWQCAAAKRMVAAVIGPEPESAAMVAAIALLAATVGPWLPGRLILGIARFIQRRSRRSTEPDADSTGTFWMLRAVRSRDDSLVWLSISVLACASGLVSFLTLLLMSPFARLYHYMLQHFFWTNLTLSGLEWLGAALVIGPTFVLHGLLITTLATVRGRAEPAQHPPRAVAGLLLGLGLALVLQTRWAAGALSGGQQFMAGILPVFILAALAAKMSQHVDGLSSLPEDEPGGPELTGGAEGLIWLSLVLWGVAAGLAGTGWVMCRAADGHSSTSAAGHWGLYISVLGIGAAAAWWHARHQTRSTSGCGMAAWAAGVGAGTAATLAAFHPASPLGTVIQLLLLGLPFGYALHYAELAWMARAGSPSQGFAQLASAVLAGLAAGFMCAHWWAAGALGAVGLIAAGSLLMMSLGGIVQVYEEDRAARVRHRRLALVFASLAAAIVVFPAATRRWDRWEASQAMQPLSANLGWLAATELPSARRVCLVGVDWRSVINWPGLGTARVDILPARAIGHGRESIPRPPGRTRISRTSPFRSLHLDHQVYDLVYQQGQPSRRAEGYPEYSIEWLGRLVDRTLPDGQIVVDVPLDRMTPEALAVISATFERAAGTPARWMLTETDGHPVFRLGVNPMLPASRPAGDQRWSPVACLLNGHGAPRAHSIQHDRLTPTLAVRPGTTVAELVAWLESRRVAAGHEASGQ